MKCSEQTIKRPVGLKFLRCEDTNLVQLDKTLPLGGELCKEIPSRGFEPFLQSCTTQRLAGILLSRTSSVRILIVFVKNNNCKSLSGTHLPHTKVAKLFLLSYWMTSLPLPPELSQLFPAKFEFCNGGRPRPEIIAQLITLLVDTKT